MRYANDPRQNRLFDVFEEILSPLAYKELLAGWQHLFRHVLRQDDVELWLCARV